MNYPRYALEGSSDFSLFEFVSLGKKGAIVKLIQFSRTEILTPFGTAYNLAFGDKKEDGTIDDRTISENGDRDKILTTVAIATYEYTAKYFGRPIFFRGSDQLRTRLYRMAISLNIEELVSDFAVYGVTKGFKLTHFSSNGNFTGFLVIRK